MTRAPRRRTPSAPCPTPTLYEGQAKVDLQLEDPEYATVTPEQRRAVAKEIEDAARAVKGAEAILSVTTDFSDTLTESFARHLERLRGRAARHRRSSSRPR